MSLIDSQTANLSVLSPPEFGGECTICRSWRKLLPWQVSANGTWGPVCNSCARPLLLQLLREKLPSRFQEADIVAFLVGLGLAKKQSELMVGDFEKEGTIVLINTSGFYCWRGAMVVEPLCTRPKKHRRRVWRRLSQRQIVERCHKLAHELMLGSNGCIVDHGEKGEGSFSTVKFASKNVRSERSASRLPNVAADKASLFLPLAKPPKEAESP